MKTNPEPGREQKMSDYLIIYWTARRGLEVQVRSNLEDAITCQQGVGGYIVETVKLVPPTGDTSNEQ